MKRLHRQEYVCWKQGNLICLVITLERLLILQNYFAKGLNTLLVGIFANPAVNGISAGFKQFGIQLIGCLIIMVYSVGMTYVIFKVVDKIKSIKVSDEVQLKGLDQEFFGEKYETKHDDDTVEEKVAV